MRARAMVWIGMTVLAAMPMTAQAQMSVGIRGGATRTTVTGNDFTDPSWQNGFTVGGYVRRSWSDVFAIEVGAAYTTKGVEDSQGGEDARLALNYFEVPLVGVFSIEIGGPVTPHIYAGPVFSFKKNCEVAVEGATPMTLDCEDPSLGGGVDTATFDFGGLVGLGVSLDMGARAALTLDGMFNLGRSAIDEVRIGQANRNRAFMVTAGVSFAIGG